MDNEERPQIVIKVDQEFLRVLDKELQRMSALMEKTQDQNTRKFAEDRLKIIQDKLLAFLDQVKAQA